MNPFFSKIASRDLAELGGRPGTYMGYKDGEEAKLVIFTEKGQKTFSVTPHQSGCKITTCIVPEAYESIEAFLKTRGFLSVVYEQPNELTASKQFIESHIWRSSETDWLLNGEGGIEKTDTSYQFVYRLDGEERSPVQHTPFTLEDGEFIAEGGLKSPNIITLAHLIGIRHLSKEKEIVLFKR